MGLLERVRAYEQSRESKQNSEQQPQGLLHRAQLLVKDRQETEFAPKEPAVEQSQHAAAIAEVENAQFAPQPMRILPQLLAGIGSIGRGIDAPYLVFGILSDLLAIESAILLLPLHGEDRLAPYCAKGISNDSISRMNISFSEIANLNTHGLLEQTDMEAWKKWFSIREAAALSTMFALPFGTPLNGLLLVTESKVLQLEAITLSVMGETLGQALGNMIRNTRELILKNLSASFIISRKTFPKVLRDCAEYSDSLLLALPKLQIHQAIVSGASYTLVDKLEQDCLRVLGSIIGSEGSVSMDDDYYYMVISHIDHMDVTMIGEQLSYALSRAFASPLPGLDFMEFTHEDMKSLANRFGQ